MTNTIVVSLVPSTLAQHICSQMGLPHIVPEIIQFADGEYEVKLPEMIWQSRTVIFLQSLGYPADKTFMQYLLTVHALRSAGVLSIIAVIPYLFYSQQHRMRPGTSQDALRMIIKILEASGIDQFVCVELHHPDVLKWFVKPVYHVESADSVVQHICTHIPDYETSLIVSPDAGGAMRAKQIAKKLNVELITLEKKRYNIDRVQIASIAPTLQGRKAILVDDMIKTGGTALQAARVLRSAGVQAIYGYFIHAVCTSDALHKLYADHIFTHIWVSNTVDGNTSKQIRFFDISDAIVSVLASIIASDTIQREIIMQKENH